MFLFLYKLAIEHWTKLKDISSDKSGGLVQPLMGIDGHLEGTSFFTGVEPAQKE